MIFGLRHRREREREREREIGLASSSSDHRPKPRRTVELTPLRSRWGDRPAEIAPWDCTPLDRTVRSSRRPLDWTLFVSISAPLEACRRWTGLVAHDPPMTDLSLSQSSSPFPSICDHSLFLLPLSVWMNGFVYWEWFCVDFCFFKSLHIAIFYYKICLDAEKMAKKMWETSRKIAFLEYNQTHENIF